VFPRCKNLFREPEATRWQMRREVFPVAFIRLVKRGEKEELQTLER
jgi:hypothetical protein